MALLLQKSYSRKEATEYPSGKKEGRRAFVSPYCRCKHSYVCFLLINMWECLLVNGFGGLGKFLSLSGRGVFFPCMLFPSFFFHLFFFCLFVFCGFIPAACLQSSAPASRGHGVSPSVQSTIHSCVCLFSFQNRSAASENLFLLFRTFLFHHV